VVQYLSTKQIAFERLNHLGHSPFRSIDIPQQLLDAVPAAGTVEIASVAFIKKFTVLLAHVFLVFFAVLDFHPLPSPISRPECLAASPKKTSRYRKSCHAEALAKLNKSVTPAKARVQKT
jgi:hypothetical protein